MSLIENKQIEFNRTDVDRVFEALTMSDQDLEKHFKDYLTHNYGVNNGQRFYYLDMAEISGLIFERFKIKQIDFFPKFFRQIETILTNCDKYVEDLIIIGLFESIQNISKLEIDIYFGFDEWLQPKSKSKWDNLIDVWEGSDWRNRKKDSI